MTQAEIEFEELKTNKLHQMDAVQTLIDIVDELKTKNNNLEEIIVFQIRYDKSPEQGYYGRTEIYIEGREVKNERKN